MFARKSSISKVFQFYLGKRALSTAARKSLSIQPEDPNWTESASLIIAGKNELHEDNNISHIMKTDYSLLMVKRSKGSSFMSSAMVFPGGIVHLSDYYSGWYELYNKIGIKPKDLDKSVSGRVTGPRLPIISDSLLLRNISKNNYKYLNPDVALRITAIRETFEETGLLLLTSSKKENNVATKMSANDIELWQKDVKNDPKRFRYLCKELGMVPNIWALYEWSNWLTPIFKNYNTRFDTIFYICCLDKLPKVLIDNFEITHSEWCQPYSILDQHIQQKIKLPPPQIYEISKVIRFSAFDELRTFSKARENLGLERWLPFVYYYDEGTLAFVYPGDFRYPNNPSSVERNPADAQLSVSYETDCRGKELNRNVVKPNQAFRITCNVDPGFGHPRPLIFPD